MVILKAKLLAVKKAEERAEIDALRGDANASWGDQMRSYVLNPYQMVKDLRTEYEVGNPQAVFDGDIDGFLEAGIRWRRSAEVAASSHRRALRPNVGAAAISFCIHPGTVVWPSGDRVVVAGCSSTCSSRAPTLTETLRRVS